MYVFYTVYNWVKRYDADDDDATDGYTKVFWPCSESLEVRLGATTYIFKDTAHVGRNEQHGHGHSILVLVHVVYCS